MANVSGDQPKYLMCVRALALLTGLAGGATVCGSAAAATVDGGGSDAADASSPPPAGYDGAVVGLWVKPESGGCDVGGAPMSSGVPVVAGVAGAELIARRRRRSDVP